MIKLIQPNLIPPFLFHVYQGFTFFKKIFMFYNFRLPLIQLYPYLEIVTFP